MAHTVDTLELLGGLSPDMLVEAHGSFAKARCIECKTEVDDDWLKEKVMSGSVARCEQPKCQKKDQVPSIKPDIVCTWCGSCSFRRKLAGSFLRPADGLPSRTSFACYGNVTGGMCGT